jgi:hypothetical protein
VELQAKDRLLVHVIDKKRLDFAKKYLNMPLNFWRKIIWSEESKFELINSKSCQHVWRKRKEGLTKDNIAVTVKPFCNAWWCVLASGVGNLPEISEKMDAKLYVDIINNNLIVSAERMGIKTTLFSSQIVTQNIHRVWRISGLPKKVERLEWPPQSPGLNIIKHLSDEFDRSVAKSRRKSIAEFRKGL